jgi:hypothetical protein
MDLAAVQKGLANALSAQLGSLFELTMLAGSARGALAAGLKDKLQCFAAAEVADTRLLVEKLTALGGELPGIERRDPPSADFSSAVNAFLERERELLAALHAVIGSSGQEPRSEALEHLIEHVLMRKQQQIDFLQLAMS